MKRHASLKGPIQPGGSFIWAESRCRHCGFLPDDPQVIINTAQFMEQIRVILGNKPIKVLSWFRCPTWNKHVGGATNSQHLKGYAVDFVLRDVSPADVQWALRKHYPTLIKGCGSYNGFTHVDRRIETPATWNG